MASGGAASYPPGPRGLPIFGNAISFIMSRNTSEYLRDLQATWGDVFTIWLKSSPLVILSGVDTMTEAFVDKGEILNERPPNPNPIEDLQSELGMTYDHPGRWLPVKMHMMPFFRSNASMDKKIDVIAVEELNFVMNVLETKVNVPYNTRAILVDMCLNLVTQACFGQRLPYGSKELLNLRFTDYWLLIRKSAIMPFMKYLPFDPFGYHAAKKRFELGVIWMREQIATLHKTYKPAHPRNYVDAFCEQIDAKKGVDNTPFTEGNLATTLMTLYIGAFGNPSTAIDFGLLHMMLNQEIQRKIQKEIDAVIGKRKPAYSDRERMPYTQAVVNEALRISSPAFISIEHRAAEDVVVKGVTIPKGTSIRSNIWAANNDAKVFPQPAEFIPERFLTEKNDFAGDVKGFVPFGVGARKCPGFEFASCQMFLFYATILQRFNISLPKGATPSTIPTLEFFLVVPAYETIFTERVASKNA